MLRIISSHLGDEGRYQCVAFSPAGQQAKDFQLSIHCEFSPSRGPSCSRSHLPCFGHMAPHFPKLPLHTLLLVCVGCDLFGFPFISVTLVYMGMIIRLLSISSISRKPASAVFMERTGKTGTPRAWGMAQWGIPSLACRKPWVLQNSTNKHIPRCVATSPVAKQWALSLHPCPELTAGVEDLGRKFSW